jgi:hypothetical protein
MSKNGVLNVESLIKNIRGKRVIIDADLARIYGVQTKVFNQAIKRNIGKFPVDFMFRLTMSEAEELLRSRSQTATLNKEDYSRSHFVTLNTEGNLGSENVATRRGKNIKYLPYAFTEHGAIMAANVLNSPSAVEMSVFVVRAFMKMREMLSGNKELAQQLAALEKKLTDRLDVHEVAIVDILQRIMTIIDPPPASPPTPKDPIGFHS